MKAITVKYYGPSTSKGSRVVASDSDRNRVSLSLGNLEETAERSMDRAAVLLAVKMGWPGPLFSGGINKQGDQVYCFAHSPAAHFDDVPHKAVGVGKCWVCGHYGEDCTGER